MLWKVLLDDWTHFDATDQPGSDMLLKRLRLARRLMSANRPDADCIDLMESVAPRPQLIMPAPSCWPKLQPPAILRLQRHLSAHYVICLRVDQIKGVDTMNKLGLMTRAAASLDLHSQTVTYPGLSDAIRSSLDAVASLRSALAGCRGLQACDSLATTVDNIISFVAGELRKGLPKPPAHCEAAWQLMIQSITCGFELVAISSPEDGAKSDGWTTQLSILAETLDALKAQL